MPIIYPGIDLALYAEAKSLRYEFIVHPGGEPSAIRLKWSSSSISGKQGELLHGNSLGQITETKPYSYTEDGSEVQSSAILDNDAIIFNIAPYDRKKTLTIDPTLSWGTYYGGNDVESCYDMCLNSKNKILLTGYTASTSGLATTGAFQSSLGGSTGDNDAFVTCLNDTGGLEWCTYFGSTKTEYAEAIRTDSSDNIFIGGQTSSTNLATLGSYQAKLQGTQDAFVAKFDSTGALDWCTYYGGNGWGDFIHTLIIAPDQSVLVGGQTNSTNGIATSGAYQTKLKGSSYNGFIACFTNSGIRKWGSYLGGTYWDRIDNISLGNSNSIYVSGVTSSSSGLATTGAFQTKYMGGGTLGYDGFLARFDTSCHKLYWCTYFGGKNDEFNNVPVLTRNEDILLCGYTQSSGLATPGALHTSIAGANDFYIARFDSSGHRNWCTYFGGESDDQLQKAVLYHDTLLYLASRSTSRKIPVSLSGHQCKMAGNGDIYLACFDTAMKQLKEGTFFGGPDNEWPWGLSLDKTGNLYCSGGTASKSGIATSGALHTKLSGNGDFFISKWASLGPVLNVTISGDTAACSGEKKSYSITGLPGISYTWDGWPAGSVQSGQGTDRIIMKWDDSTIHRINGILKLTCTGGNGCADSVQLHVGVYPPFNAAASMSGKSLVSDSAASYQWLRDNTALTGANNRSYTPKISGSYRVLAINYAGCQDTSAAINIIIKDSLKGTVYQSNGKALKNSYVYIVKLNSADSTIHVQDSVKTDTSGKFSFAPKDSVVHIVAVPDSSLYPNEMPTYYTASADFQDADTITVHGIRTVRFSTLSGNNILGPGIISGNLLYCTLCKTAVGKAAPDIKIILARKNKIPVAYTYSRADGSFAFKGLQKGSYYVWIDRPFINNAAAPSIELTTDSMTRIDLNLVLHPTFLEIDLPTGISNMEREKEISIYPVPANNSFRIAGLEDERKEIILRDLNGRTAFSMKTAARQAEVNTSSFPAGIYLLEIQTKSGILRWKIPVTHNK